MSTTASLHLAGQDATSGAAPSSVTGMGSGVDDRPTENISIDFGKIEGTSSDTLGSGTDDRPTENISLDFSKIEDMSSDTLGNGNDDGSRPIEDISISFNKLPEWWSSAASSPEGSGTAGLDDDGNRPIEDISISFNRLPEWRSSAASSSEGGSAAGLDDDGNRPIEDISISFNRLPGSEAMGGTDGFVPSDPAGASSDLLDFSGLAAEGPEEMDEAFTSDARVGEATAFAGTSHPDPTGDRIEDIVTAPASPAEDFIA